MAPVPSLSAANPHRLCAAASSRRQRVALPPHDLPPVGAPTRGRRPPATEIQRAPAKTGHGGPVRVGGKVAATAALLLFFPLPAAGESSFPVHELLLCSPGQQLLCGGSMVGSLSSRPPLPTRRRQVARRGGETELAVLRLLCFALVLRRLGAWARADDVAPPFPYGVDCGRGENEGIAPERRCGKKNVICVAGADGRA
jgi:hypothetical protein